MKLPLAEGKYRKPAGIVVRLRIYSGLGLWLFHTCIWFDYDGTRPRRADSSSGRVFPLNTPEHVVYLAEAEDARHKISHSSFRLKGERFAPTGLFVENVLVLRKKA